MKVIETLDFQIGGFGSQTDRIIYRDNKVNHELFESDYILKSTEPTTKEWEQFFDVMDNLKVWSWKKDYNDEGMLDGTQWELIIKIKGKRGRKIYGSNAYPEPKGTFNAFIKALNKLSKSNIEI
jgi:hypothetical protein